MPSCVIGSLTTTPPIGNGREDPNLEEKAASPTRFFANIFRKVNTAHGGPSSLSGCISRRGFSEKEWRFSAHNTEIRCLDLEGNSGSIFHESGRCQRLAYRALMEEWRISGEGNKLTRNRLIAKYGEGRRYLDGILQNLLDDDIQGGNIREFTCAVVVRILLTR